ncbi:hypothetical protein [Acetivibrio cellulolyticus]|uniref:hypothetical protein n=1 Tax=Acetivibrio cellulolyticus TaxID=35830 RepID=UPI0001E2C1C3|nr:hypothetical protein [Acetivibrio cellulolyticus]
MDVNSIKNIKPGSNLPKKIIAVLVSVVVVIVSFMYLNNVNSDAKEVIEIVVVKPAEGIPAQALLTEKMLEKGKILKSDFKDKMVTYDKVGEVLNKYSAYFLRYNTPVYFDQLTETKPIRNEWLYSLSKETEVLTVPYDYDKCGGDVLMPGDYVRVRVTQEYDENTAPSSDVGQNPYFSTGVSSSKRMKTEILFDKILVKDMLNSKGHSIYEVYREVQKLGEEEKQAAMTSKDFMQSVLAKSLVFEATPEQVNKYAHCNVTTATFTFTILTREGNKNLIEQLPTVEKEVETWINSNKKE